MSLHRILNNDGQGSPPGPGVSVSQVASQQPVIDPALAELSQQNNSPREPPAPRRSGRHQQPQQQQSPPAPASPAAVPQPVTHIQFMQQAPPPPYPHPPGYPAPVPVWDPYAGEWVQLPQPGVPHPGHTHFPNGNTNGHLPAGAVMSAPEGDDSDGEANGRSRKRKATDDDDDYRPGGSRRVSRRLLIRYLVYLMSSLPEWYSKISAEVDTY
jgi:hypothetical protein